MKKSKAPRGEGYRRTHHIDAPFLAHVEVTAPSGKQASSSCHPNDIDKCADKLERLLRRDERAPVVEAAPGQEQPRAVQAQPRRNSGSRSYHQRPLPTKGVGAFIIEQLRAGKDAAAIVKGIRKQFPESKSTEKDVAWYRRRLENGKEGK